MQSFVGRPAGGIAGSSCMRSGTRFVGRVWPFRIRYAVERCDYHGDIQQRLVIHEDQDARPARHATWTRNARATDSPENREERTRQKPQPPG